VKHALRRRDLAELRLLRGLFGGRHVVALS
jgi:hypothetical protein